MKNTNIKLALIGASVFAFTGVKAEVNAGETVAKLATAATEAASSSASTAAESAVSAAANTAASSAPVSSPSVPTPSAPTPSPAPVEAPAAPSSAPVEASASASHLTPGTKAPAVGEKASYLSKAVKALSEKATGAYSSFNEFCAKHQTEVTAIKVIVGVTVAVAIAYYVYTVCCAKNTSKKATK